MTLSQKPYYDVVRHCIITCWKTPNGFAAEQGVTMIFQPTVSSNDDYLWSEHTVESIETIRTSASDANATESIRTSSSDLFDLDMDFEKMDFEYPEMYFNTM
jgi:hypothetical protein